MKHFTTLLLLCLAVGLSAAPRTQQAARQLAAERLPGQSNLRLAKTINRSTERKPAMFIYTGEEQGFAIISADSRTPAVLGYSETGHLDPNDMPIQLQAMLEAFRQQLESNNVRSMRAPARRTIAPQDTIAPMLKCEWSQDWPYNTKVPTYPVEEVDEQGNTYTRTAEGVTGCVATAIAQVMYYHRWPEHGCGTIHYVSDAWNDDIAVNFGQTTYDWDNMHDTYSYDSTYTQAELDAIGTLMYHCGAGVRAAYNTPTGTGGSIYSSQCFLKANMGYDNTVRGCEMRNYTGSGWDSLLCEELQAHRPILYANYGHAWVLDGLNSQGYYHMNLGWGGGANGWYHFNLLEITPYEDGINNVDAFAVVGIQPRHRAPGAIGPDTIWLGGPNFIQELGMYQMTEFSENFYTVSAYVDNTVTSASKGDTISFHFVGEPGSGYNPDGDLYVKDAIAKDFIRPSCRVSVTGRAQHTATGAQVAQAEVSLLHRDTIYATVAEACATSWEKNLGNIEHDFAVTGYVHSVQQVNDSIYHFKMCDEQDQRDETFGLLNVYSPHGSITDGCLLTVAGYLKGTPNPWPVELFVGEVMQILSCPSDTTPVINPDTIPTVIDPDTIPTPDSDTLYVTVAQACVDSWAAEWGILPKTYAVTGYVHSVQHVRDNIYTFRMCDEESSRDETFIVWEAQSPLGAIVEGCQVTVVGEIEGTPNPWPVQLSNGVIVSIEGIETSLDQAETESTKEKFLKDGQLYIRTSNGIFDAQGRMME